MESQGSLPHSEDMFLSRARSIRSVSPHSHFLKTHVVIILPSVPRFSKRSLSLMSRHQNPVCPSPSVTILRLYISWHKLAPFERSQIWQTPSLRCASPRNCVNPIPFIYYLLLADKPNFRFRSAPSSNGFQSLCYRYSTMKCVVKSDKAIGQVDWEIPVTRTVQILCKLSRKHIGWQSSLKRRLERLLVKVIKISVGNMKLCYKLYCEKKQKEITAITILPWVS